MRRHAAIVYRPKKPVANFTYYGSIMFNSKRRQVLTHIAAGGLAALTSTARTAYAAIKDEPELKVGVVYVSSLAEIGWTRQHDLARQAMEAAFNGRVRSTSIENVAQPADAERVFSQLAAQGHQLIFGTSFSHTQPLLRVASQWPDTRFESCSGLQTRANLGTFEARYYEGTYLAGIAAALKTRSRVLGFIGGFPVPDVIGPANAFLLGARSIDPSITCKVLWLNSWFDPGKERDAAHTLIGLGADVLMSMTDTPSTIQVCEEARVGSIGYASDMSRYGPNTCLTSVMLDWSNVYVGAAAAVLKQTWVPASRWDGLAAGVIRMAPYHASLAGAPMQRLASAQERLSTGKQGVFAGPLRDQAGVQRVANGQTLEGEGIRSMRWLVEGIQGNA